MMMLNLACGSNILPAPWVNVDLHPQHETVKVVDLTQFPLPWEDDSVGGIVCSHFLEHTPSWMAYQFLQECHRLLKPSGVLRICVPSIEKVIVRSTPEYVRFYRSRWGKPPIESLCRDHGHQSVWSVGTLSAVMYNIGFSVEVCENNQSIHPELNNVDGHDLVIGKDNNDIETIVIEGLKL